ncbi:MAG: phosphopyruvate hydratase [Marine Group III euryarchaeote CG-Epi4]|uniref:Enolase n=1 Tax=Marine Group III euryarchaeote CG-Epi4 TaxID=1888998 RepID=A0A1J5U5P5_9ARCH|nr:MAG: phosphopyruvate hydratase [Marine Group III euryarchaeote CG-Epi4]
MIIRDIYLRKITDSRGNPTVEADIITNDGFGRAAAPAGASTGTFEAQAWPKNDVNLGIRNAKKNLIPALIGITTNDQNTFDNTIKEKDGTKNLQNVGGNIAVALSLACAKAAANSKNIPLFEHVSKTKSYSIPAPMSNVLGGGAHAIGGTDIQEYLVTSFDNDINTAIETNAAVHKEVANILKKKFPNIALGKGDEGAWVAPLENVEALELVTKAVDNVQKDTGVEVRTGLDVAASEFYKNGRYVYKEQTLTPEEQVDFMLGLIEEYDLHSVEDPLDQNDFESWASLTGQTDSLIIGDDLYVTNTERLKEGIKKKSTNSILIKPNQIGTLTDTIETVEMAKDSDMATVISHRSGETTDTSIAHLGVAFESHAIKTGIMGGERIAKLNELVRISEKFL